MSALSCFHVKLVERAGGPAALWLHLHPAHMGCVSYASCNAALRSFTSHARRNSYAPVDLAFCTSLHAQPPRSEQHHIFLQVKSAV